MRYRNLIPIFAVALLFLHITGIINTDKIYAKSAFAETGTGKVLVIDAGHGGADGGAVAPDGTIESAINLSIAMKMYNLARLLGVNAIMTRDSEDLDYPESANTIKEMKRWDQNRRLEIVNSNTSAVFISIHQNKYPDSRPNGPQVLYGKVGASEEFGNLCHKMLNNYLCPDNRRVAGPASKDIYLIKNASCDSVLIECGFLSNPNDLSKLSTGTHQNKIASILLASYMNFY